MQLDQCRQWLRHIQGFVLQVLKQVGGFADDGQQPGVSSMDTTTSSMEEGGCSTSTAPKSAASLNAWRTMCQEASDALGNVAESMSNGGAEVRASLFFWCCKHTCGRLRRSAFGLFALTEL